jgi:hypothetical protein
MELIQKHYRNHFLILISRLDINLFSSHYLKVFERKKKSQNNLCLKYTLI